MAFIKQKTKNKKIKTTKSDVSELLASSPSRGQLYLCESSGFMFLAFTTLLGILFFFTGCLPSNTEPTRPTKPKPPKVATVKLKPANIEPNEVKIANVEPNNIEAPAPEPNKVERPTPEPNKVEHPTPEPNKVERPTPEPNKVEHPKPQPRPAASFYNKCAGILKEFVNDKGMVDYKKLKRKRPQLKKILLEFAKLDPNEYNSWPKEDKIALWLNVYNMEMLRIIIDNYPIESSRFERLRWWWPSTSIRYIDKNIGGIDKQKFIVMKEEFTLRRIEQRFFRKKFDEPRVFFGMSYATLSSPPLRNEPYCGRKLYKQLDDQVKKFLTSPLAFRIDRNKRIIYLSAILQPNWYGKEFIRKFATNKKFKDQSSITRATLNFITKYIPKQDVFFLETKNYSIKYIEYDWRLNDSSKKINR